MEQSNISREPVGKRAGNSSVFGWTLDTPFVIADYRSGRGKLWLRSLVEVLRRHLLRYCTFYASRIAAQPFSRIVSAYYV
jgi:hypothetical protein